MWWCVRWEELVWSPLLKDMVVLAPSLLVISILITLRSSCLLPLLLIPPLAMSFTVMSTLQGSFLGYVYCHSKQRMNPWEHFIVCVCFRSPSAVIQKTREVTIPAPFVASFSSRGPNPGSIRLLKVIYITCLLSHCHLWLLFMRNGSSIADCNCSLTLLHPGLIYWRPSLSRDHSLV